MSAEPAVRYVVFIVCWNNDAPASRAAIATAAIVDRRPTAKTEAGRNPTPFARFLTVRSECFVNSGGDSRDAGMTGAGHSKVDGSSSRGRRGGTLIPIGVGQQNPRLHADGVLSFGHCKEEISTSRMRFASCILSFTSWQTWQRPTLPRLETKYHRRWGVSRPSSEWDRVQPPRHSHQVSEEVKDFWSFCVRRSDAHLGTRRRRPC